MKCALYALVGLAFAVLLIPAAWSRWTSTTHVSDSTPKASRFDNFSNATVPAESPKGERKTVLIHLHNITTSTVVQSLADFVQSQREIAAADPSLLSSIEQLESEVSVIPGSTNNTVLLSATPRYFKNIEHMILKLDLPFQAWQDPEQDVARSPAAIADSSIPSDVLLNDLPARAHELTDLLFWLHNTSVCAFESVTRFGNARLASITLFDDPVPPRHLPMLSSTGRDPDGKFDREIYDSFLVKGQPVPSEAWMWLNLMHAVTARGFVYRTNDLRSDTVRRSTRSGFASINYASHREGGKREHWRLDEDQGLTDEERRTGNRYLVGVPSPSGTIHFHSQELQLNPASPLQPGESLWQIRSLQLVSLLKHDPPVAYQDRDPRMWDFELARQVQDRNPKMSATDSRDKPMPIRNLDSIEVESLQKLQAGTERVIAWSPEHDRLQMMGAIRAKERCLKCHDVQRGDLLGAFTFWIEDLPTRTAQQPETIGK